MASLRHWSWRFWERWTSQSHSVYNQPSVFATLSAEPAPSWWPDYLSDAAIRRVHFIHDTELLKDPTTWHHDRLWDHDRIIVHKARINDSISQCHDLPSAGHWEINRTVSFVRRRYTFDHLRRRVQRYCRTCLACQHSKARHNRQRGLIDQLDMPKRQWQSVFMDCTNFPTIKDASGKKFNQMLTVTYRASKQVILIPCWWKDTARQVAEQFL